MWFFFLLLSLSLSLSPLFRKKNDRQENSLRRLHILNGRVSRRERVLWLQPRPDDNEEKRKGPSIELHNIKYASYSSPFFLTIYFHFVFFLVSFDTRRFVPSHHAGLYNNNNRFLVVISTDGNDRSFPFYCIIRYINQALCSLDVIK